MVYSIANNAGKLRSLSKITRWKAAIMNDFCKGAIGIILGGRYPHCHSLVIDDQRRAIIDAASDREKLLSFHQERQVDILITSHAHEDHLMYNHLFDHAAFWVHEADAHGFTDIKTLIEPFEPTEEESAAWEDFITKECNYVPREPDRLLYDGDVLDFGDTQALVVHAPGHTPGHCCFHFPQERLLFLADMDLTRIGPYYGDPGSDLDLTICSLKRLAEFDVDVYLTSHGKGIYEGNPELIRRYLDIIRQRENRLLDFLCQGPKTLDEIVQQCIVYGKPVELGIYDLSISERHMMSKHLDRLVQREVVLLDENRYSLLR
ncbi:MAG TPA: MBL fold metallo-hydrolase [Deltaproteobacteria bacterium]|nr:MBL fold metallo-hydrolase [Deltaproteobacteria bacterium]